MSAIARALGQRDGEYRALEQTAPALQLLGALSPSDNIKTISDTKYNPSAVAQYNQYDKVLYIRSAQGKFSPLDLAVISHEYERALQDQYFNLTALLSDPGPGPVHNSDARLAREAVVEGDAFTSMLGYADATFSRQQMLQFSQQLQRSSGPSNTDFLQDLVGFPAAQGTTFVAALRTAAGKHGASSKATLANAAVDQALRNPPTSTAEVMNPALYTAHATSTPLPAPKSPAGLGTPWVEESSDVLGAFGIGDLLQRNEPAHAAAAQAAMQAAAAWQGDRWVLYHRGTQSLLFWRLHFSNAAAALSFVRALTGFMGGRFHTIIKATPRVDWQTSGFALSIRQRSGDVAVAMAPDKSLLPDCEHMLNASGFP
jgi:hypothetical protein